MKITSRRNAMQSVYLFISGKAIYSHVDISLEARSRYNSWKIEIGPTAGKLPHVQTLPLPCGSGTAVTCLKTFFIKILLIIFIIELRKHVKYIRIKKWSNLSMNIHMHSESIFQRQSWRRSKPLHDRSCTTFQQRLCAFARRSVISQPCLNWQHCLRQGPPASMEGQHCSSGWVSKHSLLQGCQSAATLLHAAQAD